MKNRFDIGGEILHSPMPSRIKRVPVGQCDGAIIVAGCRAELSVQDSTTAILRPQPESARARLAPTMPPPTTMTSNSIFIVSHKAQAFNINRIHRSRSDSVRLYSSTPDFQGQFSAHPYSILHSQAWLPLHHPRCEYLYSTIFGNTLLPSEYRALAPLSTPYRVLEQPPVSIHLVITHIMHIHPKPVAGAMHVETFIGFIFNQRRNLSLENPKLDQSSGYNLTAAICGSFQ